MTGKYIDLADRIIGNVDACSDYDNGVADALRWLEEHPEAVPGRTITESGARQAWLDACSADGGKIYERFCAALGITVVPDPEPTNAERLAAVISEARSATGFVDIEPGRLARLLDERGVKAPEGDEQ